MKTLLFCLLPHLALAASWQDQVRATFANSTFVGESTPQLPADLGFAYQPMVVTMVASLKSREPARAGRWFDAEMPGRGVPESCDGSLVAHVHKSARGSDQTFVILTGSHASFYYGGYTNQVADVLLRQFHDPNVIALDGFQSKDFLKGRCHSILWNTNALGRDLHDRLGALLSSLQLSGDKTGLIGFSGGATLAIVALGADEGRATPVFGRGAIAVSPILDGRAAFRLLDGQHAASSQPTEGLLTYTWRTATRSLWHLLIKGWRAFPEMYERRPEEFVERGYNEMTVGFLAKAAAAVGVDDASSYYHVYVERGFQESRRVPDGQRDAGFDAANDIRPTLERLEKPLLIYFSADDPILSTADGKTQAPEISAMLNSARKNPNVVVFNPRFGGHTGATLDRAFPAMIRAFFP